MSERKVYTTLSIYPEVADRIVSLKKELKLGNASQTVEVLLTAYDIINGSGHGGRFTEAVKQALDGE